MKATKLSTRLDNWINALMGVGDPLRDKMMQWGFRQLGPLTAESLEALFHQDDMAATAVSAKPFEMMRQGYTVSIEGESSEEVMDRLDQMCTSKALLEGLIWGNLYGGCLVFLGADDGQEPEEPLDEARIRTFDFLNVIDRRYAHVHRYYGDPMEEKFGEPEIYMVSDLQGISNSTISAGRLIHESRLLRFDGALTSKRKMLENGGWSDSVLERAFEPLKQFNSNWLSVSHMMTDAGQAVFKIKGLIDMITSGEKDVMQTRMELVDMARSIARAVLLDAEDEEFERVATNFSGLSDVVDKSMMRLAAAFRMPVTVLMGQSPAGMDATGESDIRWWYDTVRSDQHNKLLPHLNRIVHLLFVSADGPTNGVEPDSWGVTFESLWQPTEKEKAEIRKMTSEADSIDVNSGVLLAEEVTINRYRPDGYSIETVVDLESRREALDDATKKIAAGEPEDSPEPEPEPQPTPEPEPKPEPTKPVEEPAVPEAKDPTTALNGAQVKALQDIVLLVVSGEIGHSTGAKLIAAAFPLSLEEAIDLLSEVEAKEPQDPPDQDPPDQDPPDQDPPDQDPPDDDE